MEAFSSPTQRSPIVQIEAFHFSGAPTLGLLNWESYDVRTVDGDIAGSGRISVSDPDHLVIPGTIIVIREGYGSSLLPIYRGRVRDILQDPNSPDRIEAGCVEDLVTLFDTTLTTPFYDETYHGADGAHSGQWKRPEIAADIAFLIGIQPAIPIPAGSVFVEQPPFVQETAADAIAKVLQPEFFKARIDEDGKLKVFKIATSGPSQVVFSEGVNLADIEPPKRTGEPVITEVLVQGGEGEEIQVASPTSEIQTSDQRVQPLISNSLVRIDIPQAVIGETMDHETCVSLPLPYAAENVTSSASGTGDIKMLVDFRDQSGRLIWAVKNVFINIIASGGDPSNRNPWESAWAIFADSAEPKVQKLYEIFSAPNGSVTNLALARPVMGFIIFARSRSAGGSPRAGGGNWNIDFTRMTEVEMVAAGVRRRAFTNLGGGTIVVSSVDTSIAQEVYDHGAKALGVITTTKDAAQTDEFHYGLRISSTWELDEARAKITVRGQVWSTARPSVVILKKRDAGEATVFGRRSIEVRNPSIRTEEEAEAIADALLAPLSSPSGAALEEWSWESQGAPHIEPGDRADVTLNDVHLAPRFGPTRTLYIREIARSGIHEDDGAVSIRAKYSGVRADQAALLAFRNLGVDLVKERADAEAVYLTSFHKVRVLRVIARASVAGAPGAIPRTDANLYDIELLSDPGVTVESIPNAFPDPYLAGDVAMLQFQGGDRSIPWLVGRAHQTVIADDSVTRSIAQAPAPPSAACLSIVTVILGNAIIGQAYSASLNSQGGSGGPASSWAWERAHGSLPPGLSVANSGVFGSLRSGSIVGTPTATSIKVYRFGIRTKDDRGEIDVRDFEIEVE